MTVKFSNTSEGPISSVDWDFGDGTTSTKQNPDHVYTVAGSYTVQLTVSGPSFVVTVAKVDLIAVQPGRPVSLEVVPPRATLAVLESAQLEAVLRDSFGNVLPDTPTLHWNVLAGGGSIDPSGVFTAGTVVGSFPDTAVAFLYTKTGRLFAATASMTITAPGLIAHWTFDEGSGTTANDSSGNGNTGTLVNNPAWVDGKLGKALDFGGSNDYVLIPHDDLIDFGANEDFSISFWFKDSTKSSSTNGEELIEKQDSGGVFYQIRSPSNNGSLRFQVDDGVDQDKFNSSVGDLADGLWHHVVFIRDFDTSITAYVDGVFSGSDTTVSAGNIANTVDLRLGRGAGSGDYDGLLDEVRFYNRVLTEQEVVDLFNAANDATPPSIDFVLASETSLQIVFSEPVDRGTATDISNYSIDNGIVVSAASLAANQITVTLTTSAYKPGTTSVHTTGVSNTLTVTSVQDLAGANPMLPTSVQYIFLDDATSPNFTVAFIADQGLGPDAEAVLNLIKAEGAQMVVHSGDFDYQLDPDRWDAQIDQVLGPDFPYFASIGNQDKSAWPGYQAKLQQRLARIEGAECSGDLGVQSACKYQGLFFLLTGPGEMGSGHRAYIRDQLAADQSLWSVCSWHKNQQAMQIGGGTNNTGWEVYEECREGGAIIATGHDHSYSRTRTLSDMENQVVDTVWPDAQDLRVAPGFTFAFVSGLAGRSIAAQHRCFPTTFPYGCNGEWASIYASDQVAKFGALFITFHVDGMPERARGVFKNVAGEIIDQFIITAD